MSRRTEEATCWSKNVFRIVHSERATCMMWCLGEPKKQPAGRKTFFVSFILTVLWFRDTTRSSLERGALNEWLVPRARADSPTVETSICTIPC